MNHPIQKMFNNKKHMDEKLSNIDAHLSSLEKDCNEIKILKDKQSVEEVLIQGTLKTTIRRLFDKGLFDAFPNSEKVLKVFLFVESRRPDLEEVNDVIQ